MRSLRHNLWGKLLLALALPLVLTACGQRDSASDVSDSPHTKYTAEQRAHIQIVRSILHDSLGFYPVLKNGESADEFYLAIPIDTARNFQRRIEEKLKRYTWYDTDTLQESPSK